MYRRSSWESETKLLAAVTKIYFCFVKVVFILQILFTVYFEKSIFILERHFNYICTVLWIIVT